MAVVGRYAEYIRGGRNKLIGVKGIISLMRAFAPITK